MNHSSTATEQDPKLDEYSPSATLITFDPPLPLLRVPLAARHRDKPAAGPLVLAFKDLNSWDSAFRACQSKIVAQCEEGARIGCAVSASNKCAPPWWAPIVGRKVNLKEREECEVREMKECVVAGKEKCIAFATEKCLKPFIGARIGVCGRKMMFTENLARDMISRVSMPNKSSKFDLSGLFLLSMEDSWVTNVKAIELLGLDPNVGEACSNKKI